MADRQSNADIYDLLEMILERLNRIEANQEREKLERIRAASALSQQQARHIQSNNYEATIAFRQSRPNHYLDPLLDSSSYSNGISNTVSTLFPQTQHTNNQPLSDTTTKTVSPTTEDAPSALNFILDSNKLKPVDADIGNENKNFKVPASAHANAVDNKNDNGYIDTGASKAMKINLKDTPMNRPSVDPPIVNASNDNAEMSEGTSESETSSLSELSELRELTPPANDGLEEARSGPNVSSSSSTIPSNEPKEIETTVVKNESTVLPTHATTRDRAINTVQDALPASEHLTTTKRGRQRRVAEIPKQSITKGRANTRRRGVTTVATSRSLVTKRKAKKELDRLCICGEKAEGGITIECHGTLCPVVSFHLRCTNLERMPDERIPWFCPSCSSRTTRNKRLRLLSS